MVFLFHRATINKILSLQYCSLISNLVIMLIMVALCNRADHYIFMLWFVLLLLFFPRLISDAADWMSAILPHMVWP